MTSVLDKMGSTLDSAFRSVHSLSVGPFSFSRVDSLLPSSKNLGRFAIASLAGVLVNDLVYKAFSASVSELLVYTAAFLGIYGAVRGMRDNDTDVNLKFELLQTDVEHAVRYGYFQRSKAYFENRIASLMYSEYAPYYLRNPERTFSLYQFVSAEPHPLNQAPMEGVKAFKLVREIDRFQDAIPQARTVVQKRQMQQKRNELTQVWTTIPENVRNCFPSTSNNFFGSSALVIETFNEAMEYEVYARDEWEFVEKVLQKPIRGLKVKDLEKEVQDCCKLIEGRYLEHTAAAYKPQTIPLFQKMTQQLKAVEKSTGVATSKTVEKIDKLIAEIHSSLPNGALPACFNKDIVRHLLLSTSKGSSSLSDIMTLCIQQGGIWADNFVSRNQVRERIQKCSQEEFNEFVNSLVNNPNRIPLIRAFFRFAGIEDQKRFFEILHPGSLGDVLASLPEDLEALDLSACAKHVQDRHLIFLTTRFFPHLKTLNLGGCFKISSQALETFAAAPGMGRLESLTLPVNTNDAVVKALAANTSRSRLKKLHLSSTMITDKSLAALADSLHLRRLEELNVMNCTSITDVGITKLVSSQMKFKTLDFSGCALLTSRSMQQVARGRATAHLESLDLLDCPLMTDEGILALAASPHMGSLKHLRCSSPLFTNAAMQGIAASVHMGQLSTLAFDSPLIGDLAVRSIAESAHMRNLKRLTINSQLITDASIKAVATSPHMSSLERLEIVSAPLLTDAAFLEIASSPHMESMKSLTFTTCPLLTDLSVQTLMNSTHMRQLERLHLRLCRGLGDASAQAIAESGTVKNLKFLSLAGSGITNQGAARLAASSNMRDLQQLSLNLCQGLQDEGVKALCDSEHLQALQTFELSVCPQLTRASAQSIAASPNMASLRDLDLGSLELQREDREAFAKSPYMIHLRSLKFNLSQPNEAIGSLAMNPILLTIPNMLPLKRVWSNSVFLMLATISAG